MSEQLHSKSREETSKAIRKLLEVAVCPECDGSGQVSTPIGENFVSHEMAIDAGDRSMEGQSMGIEYEHHECQFCYDRREMIALISSASTESTDAARKQEFAAVAEETKTDEEIAREAEKALRFHDDPREYEKYCKQGNINVILAALRQKPAAKDEWIS